MMQLTTVLVVIVFYQTCQALPRQENESNEVMEISEEKRDRQRTKMEEKLNNNLYQFLNALTTLDMEEVKASSQYIRQLIDYTQKNSLDYSEIIENMSVLMDQPKEEQLFNFLLLLRKKLNLREPRLFFQAVNAILKIFNSRDRLGISPGGTTKPSNTTRKTSGLMQEITKFITGIVDGIEEI